MKRMISPVKWKACVWSRRPTVLWVHDEGKIVTTRREMPDFEVHILSGAAATVWSALEEPRSGLQLSSEIARLHEISQEEIDPTLEETLHLLEREHLLTRRVMPDTAEPRSLPSADDTSPRT